MQKNFLKPIYVFVTFSLDLSGMSIIEFCRDFQCVVTNRGVHPPEPMKHFPVSEHVTKSLGKYFSKTFSTKIFPFSTVNFAVYPLYFCKQFPIFFIYPLCMYVCRLYSYTTLSSHKMIKFTSPLNLKKSFPLKSKKIANSPLKWQ